MGYEIPKDISIVGFDDIPVAMYMVPSLTTVRHDYIQNGVKCIELLISMINGKQGRKILNRPTLVKRGSCRRLNV
jgi:DNA-binding LacI/PurR family transcriptional regulator